MSQHKTHDPDNEWKVPLFLMIGIVIGILLTAFIALASMGVFSGESAQPTNTPANVTAGAGGS